MSDTPPPSRIPVRKVKVGNRAAPLLGCTISKFPVNEIPAGLPELKFGNNRWLVKTPSVCLDYADEGDVLYMETHAKH